MTRPTGLTRPTGVIWGAALLGLLNAAPSYYWAFGGDALLPSIGQWLIDLREAMPVLTGLALLGIALGKTCAAIIPLVAVHALPAGAAGSSRRRAHRVLWWNASRLVAAGLILYGAVGLLINTGLLLWPGLSLQDPAARLGQALLWYPMLLLWGLVLAAGLHRFRATRGV